MHAVPLLGALMASILSCTAATAQCTSWLPGEAYPGINGWGSRTLVLPNGDVVVGGAFTGAALGTNDIARWDGSTWHALGTGFDGYGCFALALAPNGDLIAGGNFLQAGTVVCDKLARWNGSSWSAVGGGMGQSGHVNTVLFLPNGDLMVGGYLNMAGSVPVSNLALWNGASWSSMGLGADHWILKLVSMPNGDVIAAGHFTSIDGQPANRVARWNGSTWAPLGGGCDDSVFDAIVLPNGDLVVCGAFATAGGQPAAGLARWDGTAWSGFGGTPGNLINCLGLHQGQLVAAGSFAAIGGVPAAGIARWNGITWLPFGSGMELGGNSGPAGMAQLPNGDLFVVGGFAAAGGRPARSVARWDGSAWHPTGTGSDGTVTNLVRTNAGFVATGNFQTIGGIAAGGVAHRDASGWAALPPIQANDVATSPNGDLVAATGSASVARYAWTGTWDEVPGTFALGSPYFWAPATTRVLALPGGDIVAGGSFLTVDGVACNHIARWNGASWVPMGTGLETVPQNTFVPPRVEALARMPNGDLIVAGSFNRAGGTPANGIARWNGSTWAPLGAGITGARCLTVLANGDLVAGGQLVSFGNGLARWNGSAWSYFGTSLQAGPTGQVNAIVELGNGHLIVGGEFSAAAGLPANNIARWDGTTWHPLGNGVEGQPGAVTRVTSLLSLQPDHVLVGGDFITADQQPSSYLAQWGCPPGGGGTTAVATTLGDGCGRVVEACYEHFPPNTFFDLDQSTMRFDFMGATYTATHQPGAPAFHLPTSAPLALSDDQITGPIALPFTVPTPFGSFHHIQVSSNGRVFTGTTPASPVAYYGNVPLVLADAQFCPLFADWDPSTGSGSGTIHVDVDASAQVVFVTWLATQVFSQPWATATFQLAIFATGDVEYRYVACPSISLAQLVGINLGVTTADPGSTDLGSQAPLMLGAARLPLQHQALSRPIAGTAVVLQTSLTPPSCSLGATVLAFTGPPNGLPLDYLGMTNCRQYVDIVSVLYWVPSANIGQSTLIIPPGPTFLGVNVLSQALAVDAGFNALGVAASNAIDLRIGDN